MTIICVKMTDISTELDSVIPRHQLLDNTAAKPRTDLIHRSEVTDSPSVTT